MNKYSLKFPDAATAVAALPQYRNDGQWITASHTHALVIFTPTRPSGVSVEIDGVATLLNELTPGFHMNLQTVDVLPAALEQYQINPTYPKLEWQ